MVMGISLVSALSVSVMTIGGLMLPRKATALFAYAE